MVIDSVGESIAGPQVGPGFRVPLVAPFGRDYVAWSSETVQRAWLQTIGDPPPALRERITAVLEETRRRGYVIGRLSREYTRVYSALRALDGFGEPDAITARVAGAFADLTLVDYLPAELTNRTRHPVASVSAPVKDADGVVAMSVTAAPFTTLKASEIRNLGNQVCAAARRVENIVLTATDFDQST